MKNDQVCQIESMAFNIFGIPLKDEKCFLVYRYINFHRSFHDYYTLDSVGRSFEKKTLIKSDLNLFKADWR